MTKTKLSNSFWIVGFKCPVCSYDKFVQSGACSGVFYILSHNLTRGLRSCRCSNNTHYTDSQRECQIKYVCKQEGLTFLGWEDKYKNHNSKFKWECSNGHYTSTSVNSFLIGGTRCKYCRKENQKENGNFYGYYKDRSGEVDSLYILNFNNKYLKVGRSFDIGRRIKQLKKESNTNKITTVKIYTGTHEKVYKEEQFLHEELRERGFEHFESQWSTETFTLDSLPLIKKLLEETSLEIVEDNSDDYLSKK